MAIVAVVATLLLAGGVAAGLAASHRDPTSAASVHKESGHVIGPATTAAPSTSSPSTSAPAATANPTLTVTECPSSYGAQQTPTARIPSTIAVSLPTSEADRLAFYSDSTRSVDPVLAPVGWSCSVDVGADGSTSLSVFPPGQPDPTTSVDAWPPTTQGVIAYSPSACEGCVADLVCPIFSNAEDQLGYSGQPCSSEPAGEQTVFLTGSSTADFGTVDLTDPRGVRERFRCPGAPTKPSA